MRVKKVACLALISVCVVTLVSCSDKVSQSDYNNIKESITLGSGLTVLELENKVMKFVYDVYNPQNEKDIAKGIEELKEVTTETEYNELISIANQYDASKQSNISDVIVKYSSKDNNNDGMERIYAELSLMVDGYKQEIAIEFVINPDNKIFKHYIWTGNILVKDNN